MVNVSLLSKLSKHACANIPRIQYLNRTSCPMKNNHSSIETDTKSLDSKVV